MPEGIVVWASSIAAVANYNLSRLESILIVMQLENQLPACHIRGGSGTDQIGQRSSRRSARCSGAT